MAEGSEAVTEGGHSGADNVHGCCGETEGMRWWVGEYPGAQRDVRRIFRSGYLLSTAQNVVRGYKRNFIALQETVMPMSQSKWVPIRSYHRAVIVIAGVVACGNDSGA